MSALPTVADDESWLDLRVGDLCIVRGKLAYLTHAPQQGKHGLTIAFADWSQMLVECEDARGVSRAQIPSEARINITARRTEDGLEGIALWQQGSVPIPLTSERMAA